MCWCKVSMSAEQWQQEKNKNSKKNANQIIWTSLSPNEQKQFDDAKDEALLKYIRRKAWKAKKSKSTLVSDALCCSS